MSNYLLYTCNATAFAVAWLHYFDRFWSSNVGGIAATLSVVWLVLQIGFEIWDRIKGKK